MPGIDDFATARCAPGRRHYDDDDDGRHDVEGPGARGPLYHNTPQCLPRKMPTRCGRSARRAAAPRQSFASLQRRASEYHAAPDFRRYFIYFRQSKKISIVEPATLGGTPPTRRCRCRHSRPSAARRAADAPRARLLHFRAFRRYGAHEKRPPAASATPPAA